MHDLRCSLGLSGALLLGLSSLNAAAAKEHAPAVAVAVPPEAQPAALQAPQAPAALAAQIIACERGTWEAFKRHDAAAYAALCCPEFYEISSSGALHTLADVLKSMQTLQTKFYTMEDVVVTPFAENVCLIRYRITVQYSEDGKDEPVSRAHASAVYVRRAGKWLAATYQETPLKP